MNRPGVPVIIGGTAAEAKLKADAAPGCARARHDRAPAPSNAVERARALRPLLAAEADAIERQPPAHAHVVAALTEGGFYACSCRKASAVPKCRRRCSSACSKRSRKADASTAWCLGQCGVCAMVAAYLDPAVAREIFDPPQAILAWGATAGEARPCRAAIARPGAGALPVARARRAGSARMCRSSSRTARSG